MYSNRRTHYNAIGPRIKQARKSKNMTWEECSEKLTFAGVDMMPFLLHEVEIQEAPVYDYELPIYAETLGVSVDWLLFGDEETRFPTL